MPAPIVVVRSERVGVWTWTDGFTPTPVFQAKPLGEDDILAHALWLERNGRAEEAEEFIERNCR